MGKKFVIRTTKFLKRSLEFFDDAKIRNNLKSCEKNIKVLDDKGTKSLPNTAGLCSGLFEEHKANLNYLISFQSLCEVVHSDLSLLRRLRISDNKIFDPDLDDVTVLNLMCMSCIYLVLRYIYEYYGMDFSSIECDYSRLKN